jgi:hypothetical protein
LGGIGRRRPANCSSISGIGRTILRRAMENASTTVKTFTLESGKMINAMEKWVICFTKRGTDTVEPGNKTISTAKVPFTIKMDRSLKECSIVTRNMVRGH